jgi:hypothetical protein
MSHAKELADRPALSEREIEVTPEMIKAGVESIVSVWLDVADPNRPAPWDRVLRDVFSAMLEAS